MNDHDDDLDRALAALPLEEPPARLHARIMAATVYRPAPVASTWEAWLVGTLVALAAWMIWLVASAPNVGDRLAGVLTDVLQNSGLGSISTIFWLAVGVSATWWISSLTVPSPRRIRVR
ncbi:MAG TPA: hypothetical protein VHT53_02415 [Candidatus Elarobacter sp.]|jgi:hypothetical protein|nr:hypothetical protein [Candidatus Elarobacter sp.]